MCMENNQGSVSERVWNAAEQAGAERRQKIEKTINRVLGLPEAAKKLGEIGFNKVDSEVNGFCDRLGAEVDRAAKNLAESAEAAADDFSNKIEADYDRFTRRAEDLTERGLKFGIGKLAGLESRIRGIFEKPAIRKEARAGKLESEATGVDSAREKTIEEQVAERTDLTEQQRVEWKALLERQQQERKELLGEQKEELVDLDARYNETIDDMKSEADLLREKASELRDKAAERRQRVGKISFFAKMLANINK